MGTTSYLPGYVHPDPGQAMLSYHPYRLRHLGIIDVSLMMGFGAVLVI